MYYYFPDTLNQMNKGIVIKNANCSWRLRDCPYSNYTISHVNCQSGGGAGVRCKVINNIEFSATVNNSVLVTWEYSNSTSHQPSSFDIHCNGQQQRTNVNSVSSGTSRVSVGELLPNASYDCCVSAKYRTSITEIRCASTRSEDLLTPTTISDTKFNMTATVTVANISDSNMTTTVVGAVLSCVVVILLVLLSVCGGALFHLVRSRASSEVPKR